MQDDADEDGNPNGMKLYGFAKPLGLQAEGHPLVTR